VEKFYAQTIQKIEAWDWGGLDIGRCCRGLWLFIELKDNPSRNYLLLRNSIDMN